MSSIKPKEERLKETIRLLKKLKDVGLYVNDKQMYQQIQIVMTQWVNGGPPVEDTYDLGTHWLELTLPACSTKAATIVLRVKRENV
jgi:hypothetical protein